VKAMPAQIGNIPLSHHVTTRLDAEDIEKLNKFSKVHGFKQCTLIRLAVREYLSKMEPLTDQVSVKGSIYGNTLGC
jgi:predicted DNA-binding protein